MVASSRPAAEEQRLRQKRAPCNTLGKFGCDAGRLARFEVGNCTSQYRRTLVHYRHSVQLADLQIKPIRYQMGPFLRLSKSITHSVSRTRSWFPIGLNVLKCFNAVKIVQKSKQATGSCRSPTSTYNTVRSCRCGPEHATISRSLPRRSRDTTCAWARRPPCLRSLSLRPHILRPAPAVGAAAYDATISPVFTVNSPLCR